MSTRLGNAARAQPGAAAPARTFELTYSESARSRTSALKQNEATFSATCGRTQRLLSGRGSALGSPSRPAPARVGGCMEGDEVWPASHSSLSHTAERSSRAKLQHHSCRSRHHVRPQACRMTPAHTSAGAGSTAPARVQVRHRCATGPAACMLVRSAAHLARLIAMQPGAGGGRRSVPLVRRGCQLGIRRQRGAAPPAAPHLRRLRGPLARQRRGRSGRRARAARAVPRAAARGPARRHGAVRAQ